MALSSACRALAIHHLNVRYTLRPDGMFVFTFHKLHKCWKYEKAPPSLVFCEYTEDRDTSVVTTLNEYIKLTYQRHAEKRRSQLLLSFIQTYVEVSSTTVSRWIKESLKLAGIDVSIFKSQQEQPFLLRLVRKVFLCQISLQEVLGPVAQHSRDFIIRKL